MSNLEKFIENQKRMEKILGGFNNLAFQDPFANLPKTIRAYNQSQFLEKVLGPLNTMKVLDIPLIKQIQKNQQLWDRVLAVNPALSMSTSVTAPIMASATASFLEPRITIPNHAWNTIHRQLSKITQLPEWDIIKQNIEPQVNTDDLLGSINVVLPRQDVTSKPILKRRKRMIEKARSQVRSLSIGDLIGIASLFIALYDHAKDEVSKNQIGIVLGLVISILVITKFTENSSNHQD